jgi:Tol biopolymer transport system component
MDSVSSAVLYSTPADEAFPRISPDGRYVAYLSDQTGRFEVYLAQLPAAVGHVQVSVAGTEFSVGPLAWSRNGRALYFLGTGGTLHSISVATQPVLHIGKPAPVRGAPKEIRAIEAAPDGRLLPLYSDRPAETLLTLVENCTAWLETR